MGPPSCSFCSAVLAAVLACVLLVALGCGKHHLHDLARLGDALVWLALCGQLGHLHHDLLHCDRHRLSFEVPPRHLDGEVGAADAFDGDRSRQAQQAVHDLLVHLCENTKQPHNAEDSSQSRHSLQSSAPAAPEEGEKRMREKEKGACVAWGRLMLVRLHSPVRRWKLSCCLL